MGYDWDMLEKGTSYEGGFSEKDPFIIKFWKHFHSLELEEKRHFLAFVTGSDRVPIRGLETLRITIAKNGSDDAQYPTSHTCFSVLLLPQYSSDRVLEERLATALQYHQGFGML